uniref:LysM domain-containing protein n=1 Tax=Tetradesmus obliquus TaxID=3088 RepID=A0A383W0W1_TETOB|eukprot:jgi/Sobl393_1/1157/SZX71325.1
MVLASLSRSRAGAGRHALLLLATVLACFMAVQGLRTPPKIDGLSPNTKLSSFKSTFAAYTSDMSRLPLRTSYSNYLTACKLPVTSFNQARANNFQASLKRVMQTNSATKLKHVAGLNMFSQMSFAERARYLGLRPSGSSWAQTTSANAAMLRQTARFNTSAAEAAAESFFAAAAAARASSRAAPAQEEEIPDWTLVLPGIKNQGGCGSCWAFATAASTEAASFAQTGMVVSLAEKQLVDCNRENNGCNGGNFPAAFDYIIQNGLTTSTNYPYVAQQSMCPAQLPEIVSRLSSYTQLPVNDEAAMYEALKTGPIVVGITADAAFQEYAGGVFTSDTCAGPPNHAVLVVGAGRDEELGADYWLLRNSWGESWGEGGYMRIARGSSGPGMCNIAFDPYQVTSGDEPLPPPPPPPGPDGGCEDTTITVTAKTSLADIAKEYKTTVARIQLDNSLDDPSMQLEDGRELRITCPSGVWSEPYGVWNNWNAANAMVAAPVEGTCPEGHYAQRFYVKPSQWYTAGAWTGSTWVGQVTMTCSDGTEVNIDAQPDFNPGWADGALAQANGFTSVSLKAGAAVDSLFGVGAQSGGERLFSCPPGMVVTGIAGGASPGQYPKGWVANLQFRCSNPFGTEGEGAALFGAMLRAPFPKVPFGLSCKTHTPSASDTWQSIASKYKVLASELMRSNPQIAGRCTANRPVFIPPCIDGVVQGTKVSGARTASARAIDQNLPLVQAAAAAETMNADALIAAAAAAQPAAAAEGY